MSNASPHPDTFRFESLPLHRDARGWVVEPVDGPIMAGQANSHLVLTEPGCVRGNHYHVRGAEVAILIGPALVRVREEGMIRDVAVPDGEAYRFFFPPGLPHAIQNTGSQPLLLIAFNTEVHDPAQPDVVRDLLIAPPAR